MCPSWTFAVSPSPNFPISRIHCSRRYTRDNNPLSQCQRGNSKKRRSGLQCCLRSFRGSFHGYTRPKRKLRRFLEICCFHLLERCLYQRDGSYGLSETRFEWVIRGSFMRIARTPSRVRVLSLLVLLSRGRVATRDPSLDAWKGWTMSPERNHQSCCLLHC